MRLCVLLAQFNKLSLMTSSCTISQALVNERDQSIKFQVVGTTYKQQPENKLSLQPILWVGLKHGKTGRLISVNETTGKLSYINSSSPHLQQNARFLLLDNYIFCGATGDYLTLDESGELIGRGHDKVQILLEHEDELHFGNGLSVRATNSLSEVRKGNL